MPLPEPRPYQLRGKAELRDHINAGRSKVALALPTGGGKTVVASSIIHSARTAFNARSLFIAPLIVLINQTVDDLARWELHDVGVLRGDDARVNQDAPVQVASIQTLARRDKPPADIVIIDECHRASSPQYRAHVFDAYPEANIIGLSATPVGLAGVFDAIVTAATYAELIADGFIAEPVCYGAPTQADLSDVRTTGGDYNAEQLETAMLKGQLVGNIVEEWKKRAAGPLGDDLRTVVFATGINHSRTIVQRFNEAGIRAEHIDGATPEDQRRACLRRLEDGHTRVVSNVGVLTEGWNQPSVRCCVLARPTKSLVLYRQMVGRCLRPWQGIRPVVIDHGGCIDEHGLPHEDIEWTLTEAKRKPQSEYRTCPQCYAYYRAALKECPQCGFAPPVQHRPPPVETAASLALKHRTEERQRFYNQQVIRAQRDGFKPGYAAAKFKEKFGEWPPWSWSEATRSSFASDPVWQDRQARRERERKFWQEQDEAAKRAKMDPEPEAASDVPEHAFADLLR